MTLDLTHLLFAQIACLMVIVLSVVCYRSNLFSFKVFSLLFAITLLLWVLIALTTLIQFGVNVYHGTALLPSYFLSSLLAIALFLFIGSLLRRVKSVPRIHDIATDTQDIPLFKKAPEQRNSEDNSLAYSSEIAIQQHTAYPDVKSLNVSLSADNAFDCALIVAKELGWEIFYTDKIAGVIEATDTSKLFGFIDDVIIRIRSEQEMSIIDVRSASRVGKSDLGANAQRIRSFLRLYTEKQEN